MFYFKIVVVLFMIGFLSFISKTNCTAVICLVCSLLFHSRVAEWSRPWRYRSCLLTQGNIFRLALCSVRIELKLRRFRKPKFNGLKDLEIRCGLQLSHEYLTSSHKPVFIGMNYRCGLHRKLKELLYS